MYTEAENRNIQLASFQLIITYLEGNQINLILYKEKLRTFTKTKLKYF